ncbi:hypothetical protein Pelo_15676 [Pelomyxa schiedti]|nr:hypothetical protein Pelo_15676 [Pelomyxa schiedti]
MFGGGSEGEEMSASGAPSFPWSWPLWDGCKSPEMAQGFGWRQPLRQIELPLDPLHNIHTTAQESHFNEWSCSSHLEAHQVVGNESAYIEPHLDDYCLGTMWNGLNPDGTRWLVLCENWEDHGVALHKGRVLGPIGGPYFTSECPPCVIDTELRICFSRYSLYRCLEIVLVSLRMFLLMAVLEQNSKQIVWSSQAYQSNCNLSKGLPHPDDFGLGIHPCWLHPNFLYPNQVLTQQKTAELKAFAPKARGPASAGVGTACLHAEFQTECAMAHYCLTDIGKSGSSCLIVSPLVSRELDSLRTQSRHSLAKACKTVLLNTIEGNSIPQWNE